MLRDPEKLSSKMLLDTNLAVYPASCPGSNIAYIISHLRGQTAF
jgi:hypothetical protein